MFMNNKLFTSAFQQEHDKMTSANFGAWHPYVSGNDNVVVDALPRVAEVIISARVDLRAIVEVLKADAVTFSKFPISESTSSIYCETSDQGLRSYIPVYFRKEVFHAVHASTTKHPGNKSVRNTLRWQSMSRDVNTWADRQCIACQNRRLRNM